MAKMLTLTVDLGFGRGVVTRSFPVLSDEELDARIAAYEEAEARNEAIPTENDSKHDFSDEEFEPAYFDDGYANEFETEGHEVPHYALQ
jgi:hypothetical protein